MGKADDKMEAEIRKALETWTSIGANLEAWSKRSWLASAWRQVPTVTVWWILTVGLLWLVGVDPVWAVRLGTGCVIALEIAAVLMNVVLIVLLSLWASYMSAALKELLEAHEKWRMAGKAGVP